MILWKDYHLAHSIRDALETLANAPGPARLVAGGTDLLLDLQQGRHPPVHTLVDVSQVPEMARIEICRDRLYIGAAAPLTQIVASPLVREHAAALVEAAGLIGGPQVRNTATLGGNVAHALPAGDGTIALLALDAQAEVADANGIRLLPLESLFLGPGRSALSPRAEVLVGFHLPLRSPHEGSAFRRVMRPQGVAIAILNLAAWIQRQGEVIGGARLAVGPSGPTPSRSREAENVLLGRPLNSDTIELTARALLAEASFRTSPHRATAEYRKRMANVLLSEVLFAAWERSAAQVKINEVLR